MGRGTTTTATSSMPRSIALGLQQAPAKRSSAHDKSLAFTYKDGWTIHRDAPGEPGRVDDLSALFGSSSYDESVRTFTMRDEIGQAKATVAFADDNPATLKLINGYRTEVFLDDALNLRLAAFFEARGQELGTSIVWDPEIPHDSLTVKRPGDLLALRQAISATPRLFIDGYDERFGIFAALARVEADTALEGGSVAALAASSALQFRASMVGTDFAEFDRHNQEAVAQGIFLLSRLTESDLHQVIDEITQQADQAVSVLDSHAAYGERAAQLLDERLEEDQINEWHPEYDRLRADWRLEVLDELGAEEMQGVQEIVLYLQDLDVLFRDSETAALLTHSLPTPAEAASLRRELEQPLQ